jgi:hypothetical protein
MLLPVAAAALLVAAAPAQADVDVRVVTSGLDNPRHIALGKGDNLYVAEAGRGGGAPAAGKSCFDAAEGAACTGATGAITRVNAGNGRKKPIATGLASFAPVTGDDAIGPHGVYFNGRSVLFTNGGPTGPTRDTPPEIVLRDPTLVREDPVSHLYGRVLKVRRKGGVRSLADIWAFENTFNADAEVGNPLVDSNAVDVLQDGDDLIVADAGANSILRVTPSGLITPVSLFANRTVPNPFGGPDVPMQAVPTGVVKGPDGAYYVSQLTGFPFPADGANVYRVDPQTGATTVYASGFTNAMDLAFGRDGRLWVLEIDHDSLLGGVKEGALFTVPAGGGTPERVELPPGTLTEPGGIANARRRSVYVTNHSRQAGAGEVLRISVDSH